MSTFRPVDIDFYLGGNLIDTFEELEEHLHDDVEDLQRMCETGVFAEWLENHDHQEYAAKISTLDTVDPYLCYLQICRILGVTPNQDRIPEQPPEKSSATPDDTAVVYGEPVEFRLPFSWDDSVKVSIEWLNQPGNKVTISDPLLQATFKVVSESSRSQVRYAQAYGQPIPESAFNTALLTLKVEAGINGILDSIVENSSMCQPGQVIAHIRPERVLTDRENEIAKTNVLIEVCIQYYPHPQIQANAKSAQINTLIAAIARLESFWASPHAAYLEKLKSSKDKEIPSLSTLKKLINNGAAGNKNSVQTIALIEDIEHLESFWAYLEILKNLLDQKRQTEETPNPVVLKKLLLTQRSGT